MKDANHKELRTLLEQLKEQGLEEVYEFYDMDKMLELSLHCRRMIWDQGKNGLWLEHEKGIDDWEIRKRKSTLVQ